MNTLPVRTAGGPISVEVALEIILRSVSRLPAEEAPLAEAAGRVLAVPVVASRGDGASRHFAWDAVDALADFLVDWFRPPALTQLQGPG